MSLGAIPFSIPAAFEAQFLAREVVRYGALLKDAETGKIVAHLQQTGIFENVLSQAPSMIGIVSNPVTTLVDAAASVTTVVQNQKIIGQLGNLSNMVETLQMVNLIGTVASIAGIGVSVAATAVVLKQVKTLQTNIDAGFDRLEKKIKDIPAEMEKREFKKLIEDIETPLERLQEVATRKNAKQVIEKAEDELHRSFNNLNRAARQVSLTVQLDAEMFEGLIAALALCHGAQLKSLIWLDEKQTALSRARGQAEKLMKLSTTIPMDKLMMKLPDDLKGAHRIHSGLADLRAVAATQPSLCQQIIQMNIDGRRYLEEAQERDDTPLLLLPTA